MSCPSGTDARPEGPSFSFLQRTGGAGPRIRKDCSVRTRAASGLTMFLLGIAIGFVALVGGCGGSPEGTAAAFSPEADKTRQDAMREYMKKKSGRSPGESR